MKKKFMTVILLAASVSVTAGCISDSEKQIENADSQEKYASGPIQKNTH